jgi:hypothetical protein
MVSVSFQRELTISIFLVILPNASFNICSNSLPINRYLIKTLTHISHLDMLILDRPILFSLHFLTSLNQVCVLLLRRRQSKFVIQQLDLLCPQVCYFCILSQDLSIESRLHALVHSTHLASKLDSIRGFLVQCCLETLDSHLLICVLNYQA